ncbi:hypothetical protein [Sediminibacterium soli]|uniref:hypothetical protein n=1 Tax=Sediminibacterium soli TaxID=2698829 RepID=UPI00137AAF82|nr:hypothetical protein [Sediminibacterium soli]NCI47470.1 hypothetical protein [Sediminibacterium soli]
MKKILTLFILLFSILCTQAQSKVDTALLRPYVGTYVFPEGSVVAQVVVSMGSNGLLIASSAGESDFNRIAADTFSIVSFQGLAVFRRDEQKKISGIVIDARGYLLEGKKTEPTGYLIRRREEADTR